MNKEFLEKLIYIAGKEGVFEREPMDRHTTFRAGGTADYYVIPDSEKKIMELIKICGEYQIPYYIIGNGSNILVKDEGYRGVIIEIGSRLSEIKVEGTEIIAGAGARLTQIAVRAWKEGLAGFEFAHGIPGTLGGAVTMNAGAYGGEMKDVLRSVRVADREGRVICLEREQLGLGYRQSVIQSENYIVLDAVLELSRGVPEQIKKTIEDLAEKRREKQPLEYPSAGSTFKRPEGYFAGKLIEDAGMKGYRRGGAMVSEKHAGFVINYDHATAGDILNVIHDVQDKVRESFGISLETEVKVL